MKLYHPKTGKAVDVPGIDAADWIRIHGMLTEPPTIRIAEPPPRQQRLDVAPVYPPNDPRLIPPSAAILALVNSAEKTYELTPIPTVGHAAAKAIIENRPVGGYASLDDLAEIIPQRTSLEAIKGWMPDVNPT